MGLRPWGGEGPQSPSCLQAPTELEERGDPSALGMDGPSGSWAAPGRVRLRPPAQRPVPAPGYASGDGGYRSAETPKKATAAPDWATQCHPQTLTSPSPNTLSLKRPEAGAHAPGMGLRNGATCRRRKPGTNGARHGPGRRRSNQASQGDSQGRGLAKGHVGIGETFCALVQWCAGVPLGQSSCLRRPLSPAEPTTLPWGRRGSPATAADCHGAPVWQPAPGFSETLQMKPSQQNRQQPLREGTSCPK